MYKKLCSFNNLNLAWMRIKTGQNIYYKNYYRDILSAYDISIEDNLRSLALILKGGSYEPSEIVKFYIPKSSGLHRPITFLHIDDLIVYQAFANIMADIFSDERKVYEEQYVYSNLFNRDKDDAIFLFKKWNKGYRGFIRKIRDYYNTGNTWIAHFDLAAYYDTIDHFVLKNQISLNSYKDFTSLLGRCLEKWSNQNNRRKLHHAIPQGPLSSAVIGEIYLLPIDVALAKKGIKYVRYVDDIKILGESKQEVLEGVIILERECKERGLIPQSKKFEISRADNVQEAIGKNPSLSFIDKNAIENNNDELGKLFCEVIDEKSFDISKVRYILKSSDKNDVILNKVMDNLNSHPELSDEFSDFLLNYIDDKTIASKIFTIMLRNPTPYEYVEGKYWEILSQFNRIEKLDSEYMRIAIDRLQKAKKNYALKLGLYKYLCSSGNKLILNWLIYEESSLIQAFAIPYIPSSCFDSVDYMNSAASFFKRSSYEPGLMCIQALLKEGILTDSVLPDIKDDSSVLLNTLGHSKKIDSVGQILKNRYYIPYSSKWKKLLGSDYKHANEVLFLSEKSFFIDKNAWVSYLDTFNDIIVRKSIHLLEVSQPGIKWPKIKSSDGKIIDFGVILDVKNEYSMHFTTMANGFRMFHERRCQTPTAHAYDKKTSKDTRIVSSREQRILLHSIKCCFESFVQMIEANC